MRIAAIDIGSNSLRCSIVDVPPGGQRVTLDEQRAYVRLGRGTIATGRLADDAMAEAVETLGRMMRIAREYEVTHVRAVATSAIREASNGAAFVARLHDELGLDVEVITGEHEGRLALLSAVDSLALNGPLAVVDIGGGSVEIVRAIGRDVQSVTSMPLGAVVLSERYGPADPMPKERYRQLSEHVRGVLAEGREEEAPSVLTLVGSGGTVTTLASMAAARRGSIPPSIHGFAMSRSEVTLLRAALAHSTAKQRIEMEGMTKGRVDLIVAGAVVLDEVMAALGAPSVTANARGMREGIVIETVERELGVVPAADRMRVARDFIRQCRAEVPHAEQVRRLALMLFDGLAPLLEDLDARTRPLLEAAALLHDVGYQVSAERHHKHSYDLISAADLPGFSSHERDLIAAIARYHAGALPKEKHDAWRELGEEDRRVVERLAAVLRIADGLDRAHTQAVERIDIELDGERLRLGIHGTGSLGVEAEGAARKSDLFESVWGRRVEIVENAAGRSGG